MPFGPPVLAAHAAVQFAPGIEGQVPLGLHKGKIIGELAAPPLPKLKQMALYPPTVVGPGVEQRSP